MELNRVEQVLLSRQDDALVWFSDFFKGEEKKRLSQSFAEAFDTAIQLSRKEVVRKRLMGTSPRGSAAGLLWIALKDKGLTITLYNSQLAYFFGISPGRLSRAGSRIRPILGMQKYDPHIPLSLLMNGDDENV